MPGTTRADLVALLLAGAALLSLGEVGRGAPAPFPRARRSERLDLVGTWRVIQASASGKHYGHETRRDQVWVITPTKITIEYLQTAERDEFDYQITKQGPPSEIALTPAEGNITRLSFRGVFAVERGRLRFCRSTGMIAPKLNEPEWEDRGTRRYVLVPLGAAAKSGRKVR